MELGLKNRRVLITGSSRGIGLGIARAFLAEGARVALTGRDSRTLQVTQARLGRIFGVRRILPICGDLTDPAAIASTLAQTRQRWGGLDILVLNLGSGRSVPGLAADAAEWQRVLATNLVSAFETLRQAETLLEKGRLPAVVFIGSIAGQESVGAPLAYGAAKAGLRHAMKAASRSLAQKDIRVNMVSPGNIWFPGGTWARKLAEDPKTTRAMLAHDVPLRRFGTVDDVAAAVVFLASPAASFVTGACLTVDGGQTRG